MNNNSTTDDEENSSTRSSNVLLQQHQQQQQNNNGDESLELLSSSSSKEVNEPLLKYQLRYIEFYCGIGGWTYALKDAIERINNNINNNNQQHQQQEVCQHQQQTKSATAVAHNESRTIQTECCAYLDHSDICIKVYEWNQREKNISTTPVSTNELQSNLDRGRNDENNTVNLNSNTTTTIKTQRKERKRRRNDRNDKSINSTNCSIIISPRTPIETLSLEQIISLNATIWMMSPPCQPHTRQRRIDTTTSTGSINIATTSPSTVGKLEECNKTTISNSCEENERNNIMNNTKAITNTMDCYDKRSNSFIYLCNTVLKELPIQYLPRIIIIENVIGFETSESYQQHYLQALQSRCCNPDGVSYTVHQFILYPQQVYLPNDRPRFYSIAIQNNTATTTTNYSNNNTNNVTIIHPIRYSIPEVGVLDLSIIQNNNIGLFVPPLSQFLDDNPMNDTTSSLLRLSKNMLEKSSTWCMDFVYPYDRRSSCFTSGYGKYSKGTGSTLVIDNRTTKNGQKNKNDINSKCSNNKTVDDATNEQESPNNNNNNNNSNRLFQLVQPDERVYDPDWAKVLLESYYTMATENACQPDVYLRYFSGKEIANVMGFPSMFEFPSTITMKQQWKLIGNSLNVQIASKLIEYAICIAYDIPFGNYKVSSATTTTLSTSLPNSIVSNS